MVKSSCEDLVEEREELMVLHSKKNPPFLRKAHFLKPFVTTIDGHVAELPLENLICSPLDSESLPFRVSFVGWKLANEKFSLWVEKMASLHEPTWKKAGIFEAIMGSTYIIHRNRDLVLAIADKWCPVTKTFIFPFGEATITLEDVMVLMGFSVLGSPVFTPLESQEKRDTMKKLEKIWLEIRRDRGGYVKHVSWLSRFMNNGDEIEIELEHEAFLVLWLSRFVFPSHFCFLNEKVIPIAIHLARGTRIALAPAVLASLYRDLDLLAKHIRYMTKAECVGCFSLELTLSSLFSIVQVWTWERFCHLRPKPKMLRKGEPRLARWHNLKHILKNVKQFLLSSGTDSFDWRPYTKRLKNWIFPRFYAEKGTWVQINPSVDDDFVSFARCLRVSQLFGINCVEGYHPNRVALQFGLDQNLPGRANQTSWDDYNRPMDGLKFYMPSRHAAPLVTARYLEWWNKSVSEFHSSSVVQKESTATFTASNTRDHESAKMLPLSSVFQDPCLVLKAKRSKRCRCEKGRRAITGISRSNRNNDVPASLKRSCENDTSSVGRCKNVVSSETDGDVNLTIAQIIKSCKKPGDVEEEGGHSDEQVGKRMKCVGEENNSSDPPQKATSIGNEPPEMRQTSEKTDESANKEKKMMMEIPSVEPNMENNVGNGAEELKSLLNRNGLQIGETSQPIEQIDNTPKSNELLDNGTEKKGDFSDGRVVGTVRKQVDIIRKSKHTLEVQGLKLEMRILELQNILREIREWKTRKESKPEGVELDMHKDKHPPIL